MAWISLLWKFGAGDGIYAQDANGFPTLALVFSYFAVSPAFFFALAGVNPKAASRSWGYLVEATWPVYLLDHVVNLVTISVLYWLVGAPMGWGVFLPVTQSIYFAFYATRGYVRRVGYNQFDDEKDEI